MAPRRSEHDAEKDVTRFLLARIAEDGAFGVAEHADPIVREYAARLLAECAAKRELLGLHESIAYYGLDRHGRWLPREGEPKAWYCECQAEDGMIQGAEPCETKRILAAVYADHPDYRDEWADTSVTSPETTQP